MCQKFTPEQLKNMDMETKDGVIFQMQDRLDKLEHDYENLIEQIRLANQQRFGRHTEKLGEIAGQLSFFNEAEAVAAELAPVRDEFNRLIADKSYLNACMEAGAQKAACVANRTLRKAMKRVGFYQL